MGLLQTRINRVSCRAIEGKRSKSPGKPLIPVPPGHGLYGRWPTRLGQAVSAAGTTGRSQFLVCGERQGGLRQDLERATLTSSAYCVAPTTITTVTLLLSTIVPSTRITLTYIGTAGPAGHR